MALGWGQAWGAGAQGMAQFQMLRDQLAQYPDLLAAQLKNSQATAGIAQNTLNFAPQASQAAINLNNANANYVGTEAGKNQFMLNNPNLMLPGMPGQIAAIDYLKQNNPSIFGITPGANTPTPVGTGESTTGQMMPAPSPTQGGLAAMNMPNQNGMPGNPLMTAVGQAPPMMPNSAPAGLAAPQQQMPQPSPQMAQPAPQNPGNGQMFGGNPLANQILQSMFAPMLKNQAQTQYYDAKSSGFGQLGEDGKAQMIAQGNAFGYDPAATARLLSQGYTIDQLGAAKGYTDPSNYPAGIPSPTAANRTQTNLRNGAIAELNTITPWMTQSLAPYSQRIAGYSPVQIGQAITGSDPDAQANFIAAKAITPDYNALKAKIMNGQFGIGMAEELQEQAMNNFKAYEGTVSPAVYAKAQQIGEEKFNQMVSAANNSVYQAPSTRAAQGSQAAASSPGANSTTTAAPSNDDIAYTAQKYGITPAQVKQKLGIK